ncbi:MAG: hypothetical protein OXQ28_12420 [Acidobacteriota bacterium]|nr:hypothetical protein [Acidobacteriota bacterium]
MARTFHGCVLGLALAVGTTASGCSGLAVDAREALSLAEVTTGWLPAQSGAGNKIVPVLSFRLDNTGAAPLGVLQVNAIFRRAGEELDWGSVLVRAAGREGLAPDASIGPFTLRSARGYTGSQSSDALLAHREFVDVSVELFARHRADRWVSLGRFDIDRRLLASVPVG